MEGGRREEKGKEGKEATGNCACLLVSFYLSGSFFMW